VDIPWIISADDHVVEPPDVWTSRLPARHRDVGPRIERAPVSSMGLVDGRYAYERGADGTPADWWLYEDLAVPHVLVSAAVGYAREDIGMKPITYEDMRPGCYRVPERLEDMDVNHVEASICFPTFPRFCGQTFLEAKDKELALLCVQAYNDWMVEEWCGSSDGRLIPLCLIPLWDPALAAAEVRRNAARGVRAVTFTELPANLGLPSIHDAGRHWDPFFAACDETGTVVAMHIGSGSKMPSTSADAPPAVPFALGYQNAGASLIDWLFSGVLVRFPNLRITYSEGQIGWIPFELARADRVWEDHRGWNEVVDHVPEPPSTYYWGRVYGCFFDDAPGLEMLHLVGADQVTFEVDYPHSDSTWPNTLDVAQRLFAGLDAATVEKVVRGNAIDLFGLDR
jgi:predicted TIM-barrel fold metal-dependent hydrolase